MSYYKQSSHAESLLEYLMRLVQNIVFRLQGESKALAVGTGENVITSKTVSDYLCQ